MKIEEVVKLYDLISNISWLGIIGILLFISAIIVATFIVLGKDRSIVDMTAILLKWGSISVIMITIAVSLLKIEADSRRSVIINANKIKDLYMLRHYELMGFKLLTKEFKELSEREFKKIASMFPTEFVIVNITDKGDPLALKFISPDAVNRLNTYYTSHLGFIKEAVSYYMKRNNIDSLSYNNIRNKIDIYFYDEWIEYMLSSYDSVFSVTVNPDTTLSYSDKHFVVLK